MRASLERAGLLVMAAGAWSCSAPAPEPIGAGVSLALAQERARTLSELRYQIGFEVPASAGDPVSGRVRIELRRSASAGDLVLDFEARPEQVRQVRSAAGERLAWRFENGHLVVPAAALPPGATALEVDFVAGDGPLNRNDAFLYTLFVPDRARHAFPCFDQPDLKGRFQLSLTLPTGWQALANGRALSVEPSAGSRLWRFAETPPLSSYLFSFVAGEFQVEQAERAGRRLRFLHRETDPDKLARNRDAIFDLHAAALAWLEEYTGSPLPFEKLEFALIPAFQFGGMEHPGAVLYRDAALLLDESATEGDRLGRASLIAHETAHMWFGDLVTMRWFDDVWMKEVFANFAAAKIVEPAFPKLDHELRFLLSHFPAAYAVDRSPGANPIRQPLENLSEAGSLYGAIIYQKAPTVLRQLEALIGAAAFRDGVRAYLAAHRFSNAGWPELIAILDGRTPEDLVVWSRIWVEQPGRPTVAVIRPARGGLAVRQSDPAGEGRLWNQRLCVASGGAAGTQRFELQLREASQVLPGAEAGPADWVLAGACGRGYARFQLDAASRAWLLEQLPRLEPALLRGVAWLSLWDARLEAELEPRPLLDALTAALAREPDALLTERLLEDMRELYWRQLDPDQRSARAPALEALLRRRLAAAPEARGKALWLRALRDIAVTPASVAWLSGVWRGEQRVPGLPLSEQDLSELALELAVREAPGWEQILERQTLRIDNPDRRARFEFVRPALSADPGERDAFFESLRAPERRTREPWVLEGLRYLHHPLRAESARKHIRPSLDLLPEIQRTGDIFFPRRWLDATLGGHSSPQAAASVREWLAAHPELPPRLRGKLLQAADGLFRAARSRALDPLPVS